jgi:hypothetical protein
LEKQQAHITRIQAKTQELIRRHAQLQKKTAQQEQTIQELRQKTQADQDKIRRLEEQQHVLKAAAGSLTTADKKSFEQAINRYIREIDKCIALLSE